MSIIRKRNPITGEWETFSVTSASEMPILDIKDNFTSKNVEGALRELSDKNAEINSKVSAQSTVISEQSTAISEHSSTLRVHAEDIAWLKENGGGGGGGTSAPTITSKFEDGTIVQKGEDVKIPIFFTSPNQGNGIAYIVIDGIEVASVEGIKQGNNTINIGKLSNLRNNVAIYVKDRTNALSNQLEWTIICGGIDLEVNFDDTADYGVTDQIIMQFTVQSASSEPIIMHMTVDYDTYEVECTQGVNEYMFVGLGVGVHKVSFYLTSGEYRTNTVNYNIVVVSSNSLFVSSSFEEGQFTYGTPVAVQYRVSKASDEYFEVKLYLNDVLQKTLSVQAGTYYWTINDVEIGTHNIRIEVRSAYNEEFIINKTFEIVAGNYTPLKITEAGLVYRLNAKGRTNQDSDRAEPRDNSGNGIAARLYNFNWYTNGWIDDELVCDSNAYVEIDCYPWSENAIYGSTIEVQFTGLDIGFNDARIFDYTDIETPYKGVYIDLEESTMKSLANTGKVNIDKDVETTVSFAIDRKNKFGKIYIDGICSRAFSLSDTGSGTSAVREDFTHTQRIYLNSRKGLDKFGACKIKDIRIYSRTLSDDEIVQNNIAQVTDLNAQEKLYKLNYENTTLPTIKMYGDTTNMTLETPVTMRIKYTSPNEDKYGQSFDLPYCTVNWQGTSSLQYVLKNFTARLKDENMADYYYTPYSNGVLENVYCFKCDYMESTHSRNVGLAKFVNDCLYDTKNPAQQKDDKIRNSIAGFPCLLYINDELQGVYNFNLDRYSTRPFGYTDPDKCIVYEVSANSDTTAGAFYKWTEASGKSQLDYYKSDFECLYPPTRAAGNDNMSELIRLIEWVNDSSDEDFKDNIGRYFNLEYLLRYYLFVLVFGAVDSLGKNMKLATWDGLVWYPQVYDADTTIGLDNTGFLKFDMDIEMGDENVFNTTGSQLWRKVVLLFDAELKAQYSLMRQDRFTVDNIMKYLYGEQISQIPAYYYNKDMQSKYLNFGSSYLYALHGSGEQHIRKWIRERLMYCDTLLGYRASSSDYITLRSSKLGEVYLDVETYIPMYLSIKWRDEANNTGLQTKRVGRGEKVRFTYNMPTATDQEIIVYAGHYLKSLGDVSNLQPTSMLIANADRLTEIVCHSPNLINTDLSECTKLQRIDLSDCTALGTGIGAQPILNIQNCKYLRYCNCMNTQLTAIYTMQAGGNLEEIYYPQSTQVVQLTNQTYLHTVGLPSTNPCENLADVMITNCNAVKSLSSETTALDFNTFKYVQNLNITNSLSGLNSMQFNGFDKLKNVTLSSLKELDSIGFEDMLPVTTTSTLKNITISDCPLITSLSFNVSSDNYKVAFATGGKLDLGGMQSLRTIECNTSVKGLNTLIVPTSLKELKFLTTYGDGLNEIKNIWSASAVHNDDGFEGIDFQDMTVEFVDMLGLNAISNAINFHIAPKDQNPNLNTARDGSTDKPWFHPIGSIDLSNYTGSMIGMLRGIDLNKLDVVISTDREQIDLTSLFECATIPTAQNIVAKTNNILNKFPKSVIWDYMFKGCALSFSPKDITIPNRGLSLKGMYKDSDVTEDVSLPNVTMAVDEMFMNCTGITTYEENWLKTYSKITYTVPTSNGTSGYWDDNGNYTESTSYNQFLYTPSKDEKVFKIMTTGIGEVRINYFLNSSFLSRKVYTPENDNYPYVVTIPDNCNKIIFVCDTVVRFVSEGNITTKDCYANTGGDLAEIPVAWGGYGFDKSSTSIYVIDTTNLSNTTTFNLVTSDKDAGLTDWGDGTVNAEKSHTYREHGVYTIKTKSCPNGVAPHDDVKNALIEVKQIKLIGHNGNTQSYSQAFMGCKNLAKVTAYNLSPTDCSSMFSGCNSLTEIIGLNTWNMSNCNKVNQMFEGCTLLSSIEGINTWATSKFDGLFKMFVGCKALTDISFINDWDLSNVRLAGYAFYNCTGVTGEVTLQLDMPKCTSLNNFLAFTGITALNVTGCNIPLVTDLESFVGSCNSLTSLIGTESFNMGSNLQNLATFAYNTKLTSLNLSGWDFTNVTNISSALPSTLTTVTLNNVVDNRTERTSDNGLRGFLNIGGLKTIVMDEIAMTDFSNLFLGVTKIKNDIVFPSNATNVSNCFNGCTGMTHIHSNWKTTYDEIIAEDTNMTYTTSKGYWESNGDYVEGSDNKRHYVYNNTEGKRAIKIKIVNNGYVRPTYFNGDTFISREVYRSVGTVYNEFYMPKDCTKIIFVTDEKINLTIYSYPLSPKDCYLGCTGVTHCDEVACDGLDEVPMSWGGNGFSKATTSILELVIPEDNYTFTLSSDNLLANFDAGQTSGYNIYNRVNWGDGTITEGEISHTYEKAGTYTFKGHYYMGQWLPTDSLKACLTKIKQIPRYTRWLTSHRYLAKDCTKLTEVTINNLKTHPNDNALSQAFYGCTNLKKVTITVDTTSKINDIKETFRNCTSLVEINGIETWDISGAKSLDTTFCNCASLTDEQFAKLSNLDVSNVTSYNNAFNGCKLMTTNRFMDGWVMTKATSFSNTFADCTRLIECILTNKYISNNLYMQGFLSNCSSLTTLDLTNLCDTTKQVNLTGHNIFYGCSSLTENPYHQLMPNGKVDNLNFIGLTGLTNNTLDCSSYDSSRVESISPGDVVTKIIGISGDVKCSVSCRNAKGDVEIKDYYLKLQTHQQYDWFYHGVNGTIKNIDVNFVTKEGEESDYKVENLKVGLGISFIMKFTDPKWTVNSFVSFFNCLYDYASEGASANYTIKIGSTNLAKLTDEQIAIATNKGWTISA